MTKIRFPVLLASYVLSLALAGQPAVPAHIDPAKLIGLWGCERLFGPQPGGELTIRRNGAEWSAEIDSYRSTVRVSQHDVSFSLVNGQGDFRGHMAADGNIISGEWIGPQSIVNVARFASPLQLHRVAPDIWRGVVNPLADRLSLYLVVRQRPDHGFEAFFRNPDRNLEFGELFQVTTNGNAVELKESGGDTDTFEGSYDVAADRLTIFWPSYGVHLDFVRRNRDEANGFYARDSAHSAYVYSSPIQEDDGWTTASLSDVEIDPHPISALIQHILDTNPFDPEAPLIQSVLIAHRGKLVLEEYFYGFSKERPHDLRSAPKSFSSLMVGIALDRGAPFNVATPVYSLFPEYSSFANPDPRKRQIRVEDLLTMSSGFACDESDKSSPGRESLMYAQKEQLDWYKYILDLPLERAPGEKTLVYCTGAVNLLGGILRNTTKEWTPDFFRRHVGTPLQMRDYYLYLTPKEEVFAAGGHFFRARDTLKIGQLFLSGGIWNGRRVISKEWIERSTAYHSRASDTVSYGYNWWRHDIRTPGRAYHEYEATGNGGQLLMVIPDLDLVVLFNGGNYGRSRIWNTFREELTPRFIIPAVQRTAHTRAAIHMAGPFARTVRPLRSELGSMGF